MSVKLRLLDSAQVEYQAQQWELPAQKPVYLLLYLAPQPGWVSRQVLAELFAPGSDESTATPCGCS